MAESWADVEWCFVTAPACPHCGCPRYKTIRSITTGDGSTTRKAICRECDSRFKICVELPNFGSEVFAPGRISD